MPQIKPDLPSRVSSQFRCQIGQRIREVLDARGLHQRDLAALSGLRGDLLRNYVTGAQSPPVYSLARMASALGVPPDLLLPEVPLPLATDQELYRLVRRIWLLPPEVRAAFALVLRAFCGLHELDAGGLHAPRR